MSRKIHADRPAASPGWLLGLLLVAMTVAAYQPVWHAEFIWDDDLQLTANRFVQAADGLRAIWLSTELADYFPLTSTAFWLQWRLWGDNPLGYHLVNVLLHGINALLLWRLLAKLAMPGAWFAAAVFALHPVNVESVAWISELKNTLAMFFFVLTLLAYWKADETRNAKREFHWGWYLASLMAFVLALLSKTAVAPLPLVLLGICWWRHGRLQWRDAGRTLPFFAVAAGLALATIWFQYHRSIGSTVVRTDGFGSRIAGAGWAFWFYLYKAVWPADLAIIYPRWRIDAASLRSYMPALLAAAVFVAAWRYRRHWGRNVLMALGYFLVMLLPVLGFIDISFMRYSLVADRWQYFAILGPIALAAALLSRRTGMQPGNMRTPVRDGLFQFRILHFECGTATLICAALLLALGSLTWRQTRSYRNAAALWERTLASNPDCSIANNVVGNELFRAGRVDAAIACFEKALETLPEYEVAHYNLGCALAEKGQVEAALAHLRRAVEIEPSLVCARYNLGTTLLQLGQPDEAIVHLRKAVVLQPEHAQAHNNLGAALLQTGDFEGAIRQYEAALAIEPGHAPAHNNLGWVLLQTGQPERAARHLATALQIDPNYASAHNNLGSAMTRLGHVADATAHFRKALELQPDYTDARLNLGNILLTNSQAETALAHLTRAVEIAPTDVNARTDLANALLATGQVTQAAAQYDIALELQPDNPVVRSNRARARETGGVGGGRK